MEDSMVIFILNQYHVNIFVQIHPWFELHCKFYLLVTRAQINELMSSLAIKNNSNRKFGMRKCSFFSVTLNMSYHAAESVLLFSPRCLRLA